MSVCPSGAEGCPRSGDALGGRRLALAVALLALVAGVVLALLVPAGAGLDEPMHVARVEQIAEGVPLPQEVPAEGLETSLVAPSSDRYAAYGGKTDSALYELVARGNRTLYGSSGHAVRLTFPTWDDGRLRVDGQMGEGTVTWVFANTSINSPLSYAPHVVAYLVATLLTSSPLVVVLAMRLAGVVTYAAGCYLCMRLLPVGRRLFALVALLPQSLCVNSMVTADLMTFLCASVFVSCVLRVLWRDAAAPRDWALMWVSLFGLCLGKVTYAPFGLLLLALPAARASLRSPRSLGVIAAIGLSSLAAFVLWYLVVSDVNTGLMWSADIDPQAQASYVLSDPLAFLGRVADGVAGADLLALSPASSFNNVFTSSSLGAVCLAAAMLSEASTLRTAGRPDGRVLVVAGASLAAVCAVIVLLVYLALYLQFNAPGAAQVEGVQTRYFLPLELPVYLALLILLTGCLRGLAPAQPAAGQDCGRELALERRADLLTGCCLGAMTLAMLAGFCVTMFLAT